MNSKVFMTFTLLTFQQCSKIDIRKYIVIAVVIVLTPTLVCLSLRLNATITDFI